jgi:hypothetical protein
VAAALTDRCLVGWRIADLAVGLDEELGEVPAELASSMP